MRSIPHSVLNTAPKPWHQHGHLKGDSCPKFLRAIGAIYATGEEIASSQIFIITHRAAFCNAFEIADFSAFAGPGSQRILPPGQTP